MNRLMPPSGFLKCHQKLDGIRYFFTGGKETGRIGCLLKRNSVLWPWLHTRFSVPCIISVNSECCTVNALWKKSDHGFFYTICTYCINRYIHHTCIYVYVPIYVCVHINIHTDIYSNAKRANWYERKEQRIWMFSVEFA